MCPLDDILDEGSKFQYSMFISFPQFTYCSHDEVYFPNLSCLIAADGGTLHAFQMDTIQRLLCITFMTSQSHLWRSCCIVMSRGPWLLRRFSNEDLAIMIGGGVVKICPKVLSFQGNIYIDQYDDVGRLHWHVCVAQDIYVGKICIACLARLSGDGTLVVHFTSPMTSLISTRHPRDVVRVGVWNSLGL